MRMRRDLTHAPPMPQLVRITERKPCSVAAFVARARDRKMIFPIKRKFSLDHGVVTAAGDTSEHLF